MARSPNHLFFSSLNIYIIKLPVGILHDRAHVVLEDREGRGIARAAAVAGAWPGWAG